MLKRHGHQPKKVKSIGMPPKTGSSIEKSESKEKLEMKLTQYDEEDYDNYYILRGLNSNSDRVLFEIPLEDFPSNQTIEKIIKNKSKQTFYLIDTLEIEEVKSKITRFIVDED